MQAHGFSSEYVSTTACHINIVDGLTQIHLPGFDGLPLAVFVRGIPGGTLEQVIFRLNILHTLSALGIVVYNNPCGIERTVDKAMTTVLLRQAGLPTPDTWICESKDQAEFIYQRECRNNRKLIVKPLFGSQGIGIHLLEGTSGLIDGEKFAGVYYLQSFIDRGEQESFDIRVFVVNGKAIAAMTRHSKSWLTNRTQGAECRPLRLDKTLSQLSESAVQTVGIEYGGVDLIPDKAGQLHIIEVNSIPAWWGLQKVTDNNIATCLVDDMIRQIHRYAADTHKAEKFPQRSLR